jgi:hypothetical protein
MSNLLWLLWIVAASVSLARGSDAKAAQAEVALA